MCHNRIEQRDKSNTLRSLKRKDFQKRCPPSYIFWRFISPYTDDKVRCWQLNVVLYSVALLTWIVSPRRAIISSPVTIFFILIKARPEHRRLIIPSKHRLPFHFAFIPLALLWFFNENKMGEAAVISAAARREAQGCRKPHGFMRASLPKHT